MIRKLILPSVTHGPSLKQENLVIVTAKRKEPNIEEKHSLNGLVQIIFHVTEGLSFKSGFPQISTEINSWWHKSKNRFHSYSAHR